MLIGDIEKSGCREQTTRHFHNNSIGGRKETEQVHSYRKSSDQRAGGRSNLLFKYFLVDKRRRRRRIQSPNPLLFLIGLSLAVRVYNFFCILLCFNPVLSPLIKDWEKPILSIPFSPLFSSSSWWAVTCRTDRYSVWGNRARRISISFLMHCTATTTQPLAKLAHSATIHCVMNQSVMSPSTSDSNKDSVDNNGRPSGVCSSSSLPQFNRSQSFDARRQVWARVEAHWARMTTDDRLSVVAPSIGFYSVVKYDPGQDQVQPLYQRLRSWLSSGSSQASAQQNGQQQQQQNCPVMTKVAPFIQSTLCTFTL